MRAHQALALSFGLWLLCASASAQHEMLASQGLSAEELGRLGARLGSPEAGEREAACRSLSSLGAESLPGIEARLLVLRRQRPEAGLAKAALGAFRRAVGSRRGDDAVDLAPGVPKVLASAEGREPAVLAMAEPLLLLRSLERLGGRDVGPALATILTLDEPGVWDFELALARARAGLPLLPALIVLRSHDEARVRTWAQAGVRALGMEDPGQATSVADPHLAAEVARAYVQPLDFAAMPTLVRLVNADKLELRDAARFAVQRFSKNAIWQLRQLYSEVTSQEPSKSWDADRTAKELYAVLDRSASEETSTLLAKGLAELGAGKLGPMQRHFDELLARFPRFAERAKLAPGYAALGTSLLARGELQPARDAFQRALRLAPGAEDASRLRAQLALVDAELAETRGLVDLHGYDEALRHDPALAEAALAKDRLTGARAARERRNKRLAAVAAIVLLLGSCAMLLRGRRLTQAVDPSAS